MKRVILASFVVLIFLDLSEAGPLDDVRVRYNVNESSSQAELAAAFNQAVTDIESNVDDPVPFIASKLIYDSWLNDTERLRAAYDGLLSRDHPVIFLSGIEGIIDEILLKGATPSRQLRLSMSNRIWNYLETTDFTTPPAKSVAASIARRATLALLALGDDRGLEAALTETSYISTLQETDDWDGNSPLSKFVELVASYSQKDDPESKELALFYDLCRKRKLGGTEKIESTSSVIDLSKLP